MIYGMLGKPRTGKSYECVVNHIIPTLVKAKRKIVTNLPLKVEHFVKVYGEEVRDLIHLVDGDYHSYGGERPFSKVEHYTRWQDWQNEDGQRVYFFIDECHLCLPSQGADKETVEFYSMHGHYGFDIMLITQNFRKVNRDIKDMVDVSYRTIKKTALGQEDKYILKVSDSPTTSARDVIATHEREYEKRFFPFYQSHTKSDVAVNEAKSNDIQVWWKHWTIKASVAFFIFGFFIISTKLMPDEQEQDVAVTSELPANSKSLPVKGQAKENHQVRSDESDQLPIEDVEQPKTLRQLEYEKMLANSATFHPFYKMKIAISGYAEYMDYDRPAKVHYFSASQNGQHVFTLKTSDFLLAGYEVQVLAECAVKIKFYDYEDYVTCDAPTQSVTLSGDQLASNN